MKCFPVLTVPTPPVLANYSNLAFDERPKFAAVMHVAALEFVTMALGRLIQAAEWGAVCFQSYDPQMGQGG